MVDGDLLEGVTIPSEPCPPARFSLREWYEEAEGLDHLLFVTQDERDAEDWADRDSGTWAGRDSVVRLAREGKTLDEIAGMFGATVEEIAWPLARSPKDVPRIITVERAWRQHPGWGAGQLARELGEQVSFVTYTVRRLGGTFQSTARRRDGGGDKYTAEQYAAIRELREVNMSYGQIGKRLGIARTTVVRICVRRGYKPKVAEVA